MAQGARSSGERGGIGGSGVRLRGGVSAVRDGEGGGGGRGGRRPTMACGAAPEEGLAAGRPPPGARITCGDLDSGKTTHRRRGGHGGKG